MDKISILMPVRNGLPYLQECLDSILNQSISNWELIVVNDHSTDTTKDVLIDYSDRDERIIWYENKGKGIIDALQTGFEASSGNIITRMDADDIMAENKLELLASVLTSEREVATGYVEYIKKGGVDSGYKKYEQWLNRLCETKSHFDEIYKECVIPSPCWMMHRSTLLRLGEFKVLQYPEDYDLVFRMYENELLVKPVQEVLHYWRDHDDRASRNDPNYLDNRFLDLKIHYFAKLEVESQQTVQLLGAGKKAKYIASEFLDKKIPFEWYSNNSKKIGKDIYGVQILDEKKLMENAGSQPILVAIANPKDKAKLEIKLQENDLMDQAHFFA